MLWIRPIQDKTEQRRLAAEAGAADDPAWLAYAAEEADPETREITAHLGFCSFEMHAGDGVVHALKAMPDQTDAEALVIMGRTMMNFLYRCGVGPVTAAEGAGEPALLSRVGFVPDASGTYTVNVKTFYETPCHERHTEES